MFLTLCAACRQRRQHLLLRANQACCGLRVAAGAATAPPKAVRTAARVQAPATHAAVPCSPEAQLLLLLLCRVAEAAAGQRHLHLQTQRRLLITVLAWLSAVLVARRCQSQARPLRYSSCSQLPPSIRERNRRTPHAAPSVAAACCAPAPAVRADSRSCISCGDDS